MHFKGEYIYFYSVFCHPRLGREASVGDPVKAYMLLDPRPSVEDDKASIQSQNVHHNLGESYMTNNIEIVLDTRGLVCPLPLLKAKQALKKLSAEESLRIWVDDKASLDDLRLLFSTADVQVQESTTATGYYFLIQKKA